MIKMTDEKWIDNAKFQGETVAALKAIHRELQEIKQNQRDFTKHCRITEDSIDTKITDVKVRIAGLAAVISVITSMVIVFVGSGF